VGAQNVSACSSSAAESALNRPTGTNNGNVAGYYYVDRMNGSALYHTASYTYDGVNRLTNAVASGNATYNLTFSYTQDGSNGQYGNMSCVTNAQTVGPCANLSFNAANNHITTSGYTYDAAGNQTKDSSNLSPHTYQWDAEGRVASVDGGSTWSFTYNALGDRVQWAYSGGADQHFFDPEGNWLGNYGSLSLVRFGDRALVVSTGSETDFNHVNALGSTTMWTNHTGSAVEDMVFYPWGDVWQGSGGYNFAYLPYRDVTTTTDITTARFSSPNFGRWLSADPIGVKAVKLDDPQTWNMYAYVRNNPTTLTDPTGLQNVAPALTCSDQKPGCVNGLDPSAVSSAKSGGEGQAWSLSWQFSASASFLGQELLGVADTTVAPVLNAVEHPVDTAEGLASAVAHPVDTAEKIVSGAVDTANAAVSGDPRAIGQVAGAVIATAAGVKGAQAATEEAQGLQGVVNRVAEGPRQGEIQHVAVVNNKGNLIHVGREGTGWHIGLGRGGGASGAGAAIHIPLPSWLGRFLN
jgi:RHS repeat-associated protein